MHYSFGLLSNHLSSRFTYHNVWHSEREVFEAASRFAKIEVISQEELNLLLVAVAYHDIGFLDSYEAHEAASVVRMQKALPRFGFSPAQISLVEGLIWATKLPQTPHTKLEAIMADADLDVLGRDDFFSRNNDLWQEWACFRRPLTRCEWLQNQQEFLAGHSFFTPAARLIRQAGKEENQQKIDALLAAC